MTAREFVLKFGEAKNVKMFKIGTKLKQPLMIGFVALCIGMPGYPSSNQRLQALVIYLHSIRLLWQSFLTT